MRLVVQRLRTRRRQLKGSNDVVLKIKINSPAIFHAPGSLSKQPSVNGGKFMLHQLNEFRLHDS